MTPGTVCIHLSGANTPTMNEWMNENNKNTKNAMWMRQRERNALKFERNQSKGGVAKPIPRRKKWLFYLPFELFWKTNCPPKFSWHIFVPVTFLGHFFCTLHKKCGHPWSKGLHFYKFVIKMRMIQAKTRQNHPTAARIFAQDLLELYFARKIIVPPIESELSF